MWTSHRSALAKITPDNIPKRIKPSTVGRLSKNKNRGLRRSHSMPRKKPTAPCHAPGRGTHRLGTDAIFGPFPQDDRPISLAKVPGFAYAQISRVHVRGGPDRKA